MDSFEFAKLLMDEGRKEWQDPKLIIEQLDLKQGSTVADLACGPGFFTTALSEAVGSSGAVYAVDRDPVMISELRKNLSKVSGTSNVKVIEGSILDTGIPDKSVDVIFFANVLHDIDDKKSFFAEVKRIARNESTLFVDVDWHKKDQEIGPPILKRLSESETRSIFVSNGFEIVHLVNAGPHHYGVVARSK